MPMTLLPSVPLWCQQWHQQLMNWIWAMRPSSVVHITMHHSWLSESAFPVRDHRKLQQKFFLSFFLRTAFHTWASEFSWSSCLLINHFRIAPTGMIFIPCHRGKCFMHQDSFSRNWWYHLISCLTHMHCVNRNQSQSWGICHRHGSSEWSSGACHCACKAIHCVSPQTFQQVALFLLLVRLILEMHVMTCVPHAASAHPSVRLSCLLNE